MIYSEAPKCTCWHIEGSLGRRWIGKKLNVVFAPTADQAMATAVFLHSPIVWQADETRHASTQDA